MKKLIVITLVFLVYTKLVSQEKIDTVCLDIELSRIPDIKIPPVVIYEPRSVVMYNPNLIEPRPTDTWRFNNQIISFYVCDVIDTASLKNLFPTQESNLKSTKNLIWVKDCHVKAGEKFIYLANNGSLVIAQAVKTKNAIDEKTYRKIEKLKTKFRIATAVAGVSSVITTVVLITQSSNSSGHERSSPGGASYTRE
jgi:hypothetical protein